MKKIVLCVILLPITLFGQDREFTNYVRITIDSLSKLEGSKIIRTNDSVVVKYYVNGRENTYTYIDTPVIIKKNKKNKNGKK